MSKKPKQKRKPVAPARGTPSARPEPRPSPAAAPAGEPEGGPELMEELWRHPTLLAACVTLALTILAVAVALRYHEDMSVGAIREPTGIILLAATTLTLFASYWRQRCRERRPPA